MQAKDVVVRVQALDGAWETLGADRARGITPENVQLTSDQWGSKTASFDLRRDPKAIWPDISAFAPVEVEVGGRLVWSGRVAETPVRDSTDSVISVQCEGWQAHLDDDLYERIYAHTNLTEWVDARGLPSSDLTVWLASGVVEAGNSVIVIGYGQDTAVNNGQHTGVVLDLGPNSTAKRVVIDWSNQGVVAGYYKFRCRAFDDTGTFASSGETLFDVDPGSASSPQAATLTTARRYLALYLVRTGVSTTESGDRKVRITAAQVFADTAYESGNASVLKADQVVKDALDRGTIQLSSDRTAIDAGTFNIPELAPSEPKTPREMWNAVDAFEDRYKKIDVLKRPIYKAKPTTPEVEVGAWSGMEFEDSSANDGSEIYNRVIVKATQPNGAPLRVNQSQDTTNATEVPLSPTITNPTFATDASGWSTSVGTITRTTTAGEYDSSPAGGFWAPIYSGGVLRATTSGTFKVGVTYTLTFRWKRASSAADEVEFRFGHESSGDYVSYKPPALVPPARDNISSNWTTYTLKWTPSANRTSVEFFPWMPWSGISSTYHYVDSLALTASRPTLPSRWGFRRSKTLDAAFSLTQSAAETIGSKWLQSHKTMPFKGRAKLVGSQACREIKTGRNVPPEELLLRTGELVRFGDRIDPDTGAAGRDGRLVEAQYDADTDSVNLTIDSSRAGFEALLERLGVVLGQNRFA